MSQLNWCGVFLVLALQCTWMSMHSCDTSKLEKKLDECVQGKP